MGRSQKFSTSGANHYLNHRWALVEFTASTEVPVQKASVSRVYGGRRANKGAPRNCMYNVTKSHKRISARLRMTRKPEQFKPGKGD